MPRYKITYGVTNQSSYTEEIDADNQEEANEIAYEQAVQQFESSGIAERQSITSSDFKIDAEDDLGEDATEEDIEEYCNESANDAMQSWLNFSAKLIS